MTVDINNPSKLDDRLATLRRRRDQIDREIRELLGLVGHVTRPTHGPCTRCGYVWEGLYPDRPPRACARCHSTGWQVMPLLPTARRPSDPPHPRWRKLARERTERLAGVAPGLLTPADTSAAQPRTSPWWESGVEQGTRLAVTGLTPPPPLMSQMAPEPDWSPGDVIAAEPDGTIVLDDGITTYNPERAEEFLEVQSAPVDVEGDDVTVPDDAGPRVVDNSSSNNPVDTRAADPEPVPSEGTLVIEDLV